MAKCEEIEEEEDLEGVVWVEDWLGGFVGLADFKEVLIFHKNFASMRESKWRKKNVGKYRKKFCQDWFFSFFPFSFPFFLGNGIMNVGF